MWPDVLFSFLFITTVGFEEEVFLELLLYLKTLLLYYDVL